MEWTDALRYAWNGAACAVFVAAVVALLLPRSRPLRQGWRSKALWILSLGVALTVDGFWLYVPIGPPVVLWRLVEGWRELDLDAAPAPG